MAFPMFPSLTDREEASLRRLRTMEPPPAVDDVDRIEAILLQLRLAVELVVGESDDVSDGKVAAMGLIGRSHDLLLGAVDAVATQNRHVTAACLRGLVETIGALSYVLEAPERLPLLLCDRWSVSGHKLASAGEQRVEGIDASYEWMSDAVHPGSVSLRFGFRPRTDYDGEREGLPLRFTIPAPDFEAGEVTESTRVAAVLGAWIPKLIEKLVEKDPPSLV